MNCLVDLRILFEDLLCVRSIKENLTGDMNKLCNCPPPCFERKYETKFGQLKWPAEGPELNYARYKLRELALGDKSKFLNMEIGGKSETYTKLEAYIRDTPRRKFMDDNFAKLTVYAESLDVTVIEEVAAYTRLDLLSDFGKL